jgi:hypothetical protein
MNILKTDIDFGFHLDRFLESLPYMGVGMLGIFVIIGMLVLILNLFGRFFPGKDGEV